MMLLFVVVKLAADTEGAETLHDMCKRYGNLSNKCILLFYM